MLKRTYLRLVEMQEEQARQHLEEVRSIHNEMRGYKHDFHHHLQALKGQLEAGQVERAIAYLEQLDRSLQTVDTLLKTGNVTVDAILSAKLAQARAAGIAVTAEANLPPELSLTDLELSIVIGNLLDNAIEGCRSAAGEKFLRLSLRMKGDMLYFYLLNSAGKKQKKVGSLFRTGKTGAHGFGLHRAEAIVKHAPIWRLGEIQQRGRRVHVGIPRPRRVLNAIRAPLEAVGARSLFFGALCVTVEAEGGDMP